MSNSIFDNCLLFRINIRAWNPKLTSKRASDEVTQSYGAENGSARVIRTLLPKDASNKIAAMRNRILLEAHKFTLPYDDSPNRICTPKSYDHIMANYNKWESDFNKVKDDILFDYPMYRADAPNRLGGLYDPGEWPNKIDGYFSIHPVLQPLPKGDNIPNQFGRERYQEIKETTDKYVSDALADAIRANWTNIQDSLHWFRDVLSDERDGEAKEKLNIRTDTMKRLQDQLDLYESLNFSNDQRITDTIKVCRDELFKYNIETIRGSKEVREHIKLRTDDVLDAMHSIWA